MLKFLKKTIKYTLLSLTIGVLGGLTGSAFAHAIDFVTGIRQANSFLIFFLPLGAVATVLIYSLLKVSGLSVKNCFEACKSNSTVSFLLAPAIFICSTITHLFGGSAGREGAALQLGGGIATPVAKLFKLPKEKRGSMVLCGMSAVFAAVFGTPLAAAIFVFEATKSLKRSFKLLPLVVISSLSAHLVSKALLVEAEHFVIPQLHINFLDFSRIIVIAGLAGIISFCYCFSLQISKKLFSFISNNYLRGIIGAVLIILITLIIGNRDYNGTGMHIISATFSGEKIVFYSFALKILLTAITIGAGFKGGEIVPAFFIGATFGSAIGGIFGVSPILCAAIGMLLLFAGSTKCPLAAFIIAFEMFGFNKALLVCLIPSLIVGITFSGKISLYNKVSFKKGDENAKIRQETY